MVEKKGGGAAINLYTRGRESLCNNARRVSERARQGLRRDDVQC